MPWKPSQALEHTKKATTKTAQKAFAAAANSVLEKTGDEGRAVASGNAAVNKSNAKRERTKSSELSVADSGHRSTYSDYSKAKKLRVKNGQSLGTKGGGFKPLSADLKRNISRKRAYKSIGD